MSVAPKSSLDVLLEEFQSLIDLWLPILGPLFGLSELDAIKITRQVDKFVADTEAVEHGQVDVTDGLAAMITDILEILRLLGIDWTAPSKCIVFNTYTCRLLGLLYGYQYTQPAKCRNSPYREAPAMSLGKAKEAPTAAGKSHGILGI